MLRDSGSLGTRRSVRLLAPEPGLRSFLGAYLGVSGEGRRLVNWWPHFMEPYRGHNEARLGPGQTIRFEDDGCSGATYTRTDLKCHGGEGDWSITIARRPRGPRE
jgi:hypothetical protein